jgi:hypothetical protein
MQSLIRAGLVASIAAALGGCAVITVTGAAVGLADVVLPSSGPNK